MDMEVILESETMSVPITKAQAEFGVIDPDTELRNTIEARRKQGWSDEKIQAAYRSM